MDQGGDDAAAAAGSPRALAECVNSRRRQGDGVAGEREGEGVDWAAAMGDEPAAVAVGGVWWSAKKRPVPVTLVTQVRWLQRAGGGRRQGEASPSCHALIRRG